MTDAIADRPGGGTDNQDASVVSDNAGIMMPGPAIGSASRTYRWTARSYVSHPSHSVG